jgi:hypothetical protein
VPPPPYSLVDNDGGGDGGGDFQEFLDELPFDEEEDVVDGYISSSCSISMSSEPESSHQITVPVFIEPAPPEIRFLFEDEENGGGGSKADNNTGGGAVDSHRQYTTGATADGGGGPGEEDDMSGLLLLGGGHGPASRLVHQETMHTDSGLDTEDICPASPTNSRYSRSASPSPMKGGVVGHLATGEEEEEEQQHLRLVLVRDIGIQCCAESPNLSSNRRQRSADSSTGGLTASGSKYPPELLF